MRDYLEICIDDAESLDLLNDSQSRFRVDRLEICSALYVGGLTPSPSLLRYVMKNTEINFRVLIRPRPGDFDYTAPDILFMHDELRSIMAMCKGHAKFEGLVIGGTNSGSLDVSLLTSLILLAREFKPNCMLTIHRAIDLTTSPTPKIVEQLTELAKFGCDAVLTSGRSLSGALGGVEFIRELHRSMPPTMALIVGGGVSDAYPELRRKLDQNICWFHASCRKSLPEESTSTSYSKTFGQSNVLNTVLLSCLRGQMASAKF